MVWSPPVQIGVPDRRNSENQQKIAEPMKIQNPGTGRRNSSRASMLEESDIELVPV
jgi:hypothetical protein